MDNQAADVPTTPLGASSANPVTDAAGDPVAVTSTDSGFTYDSATDTWTFTTLGNKTLTWDTTVTIGSATGVVFSGTISQRISFAQAVPQDPEIVQTTCMNGDVVYPQITLPNTEGITYTIDGDVAPGQSITIEAVPADDEHAIHVDPDSDWVDASGDHIYATLEITFDDPDCEVVTPDPIVIDAPNGDLPVNDPCGPGNASWQLPQGGDVPVGFTWQIKPDGLLIAEANDGYVFFDPSGELDPKIREYGYAPDSDQACPAEESPTPNSGEATDPDPDDATEPDPSETTEPALPNTGGPGVAAGIIAATRARSSRFREREQHRHPINIVLTTLC